MFFASPILKPDPYNSGVQPSHLYQLFLGKWRFNNPALFCSPWVYLLLFQGGKENKRNFHFLKEYFFLSKFLGSNFLRTHNPPLWFLSILANFSWKSIHPCCWLSQLWGCQGQQPPGGQELEQSQWLWLSNNYKGTFSKASGLGLCWKQAVKMVRCFSVRTVRPLCDLPLPEPEPRGELLSGYQWMYEHLTWNYYKLSTPVSVESFYV